MNRVTGLIRSRVSVLFRKKMITLLSDIRLSWFFFSGIEWITLYILVYIFYWKLIRLQWVIIVGKTRSWHFCSFCSFPNSIIHIIFLPNSINNMEFDGSAQKKSLPLDSSAHNLSSDIIFSNIGLCLQCSFCVAFIIKVNTLS